MPELPEVETIRRSIDPIVKGRVIKEVSLTGKPLRISPEKDFAARVINKKITHTSRVGKYMVWHTEDPEVSIVIHLGMSGRIYVKKEIDELIKEQNHHYHVIFKLDDGNYILYYDPRRFGMVATTHQGLKVLEKLGDDPFELTIEELYSKLKKSNKKIKEFLLDQEIIAGIGNIYASEILYEASILPHRISSTVSEEESRDLLTSINLVLNQAISAGGSTLKDYRKPDNSIGGFQNLFRVYNRVGEICPHCKSIESHECSIKKINMGGRSTYFCPIKQK